jgi:hypothetical protein
MDKANPLADDGVDENSGLERELPSLVKVVKLMWLEAFIQTFSFKQGIC